MVEVKVSFDSIGEMLEFFGDKGEKPGKVVVAVAQEQKVMAEPAAPAAQPITSQPQQPTMPQPAAQPITPQQPAAQPITPQPAAQPITPQQPAAQPITPQPAAQPITPQQPAAQPITPQPAAQPITPQPAAQPITPQQPAAQPITPQQPAAQPITPQPQQAKQYTKDEIARACAPLANDPESMRMLQELLASYNAVSLHDLDKSQYPDFADKLRNLGVSV